MTFLHVLGWCIAIALFVLCIVGIVVTAIQIKNQNKG